MTKRTSKFEDRVRFNWGYHDAAGEAKRGHRRELVATGPHDLTHVSQEFDAAYFDGYAAGLADFDMDLYHGDSERAWTERQGHEQSTIETQE